MVLGSRTRKSRKKLYIQQKKKEKKNLYEIHCLETDKFLIFFARTNFQYVILIYSSRKWDISYTKSVKIDGLK